MLLPARGAQKAELPPTSKLVSLRCRGAARTICASDGPYRRPVGSGAISVIYRLNFIGPRPHCDRRSSDQQRKRLVKHLADLGYTVKIKPIAA
jgi:hypothetical protein